MTEGYKENIAERETVDYSLQIAGEKTSSSIK